MDPTFPQMPTESSLAQLQPFFPTYSFRKKATALHIDLALTVHPPKHGPQALAKVWVRCVPR